MPEAIAAYHAGLAPTDAAICDALCSAIVAALPDAESKLWHGHPVWFLSGNPIVGYAKRKASVTLLFWSGQSFAEAGLHPEGKFKAAEARYAAASEIDHARLHSWLQQARTIQWDYKNIVKRKGELLRLS